MPILSESVNNKSWKRLDGKDKRGNLTQEYIIKCVNPARSLKIAMHLLTKVSLPGATILNKD